MQKTEFKCPYPQPENIHMLRVFYDIPKYYALQLIVEMEAEPHVEELVFACYSPESTVISRVTFDNTLWILAKIEIKNLLQMLAQGKVPTQRTLFAKEQLPKRMVEFLDNCVELMIEVPSVRNYPEDFDAPVNNRSVDESMPYNIPLEPNDPVQPVSTADLWTIAEKFEEVIQKGYDICRLKAKELFVCLLSSAKRSYDPEKPSCFPIFYGLKARHSPNVKKGHFMTK